MVGRPWFWEMVNMMTQPAPTPAAAQQPFEGYTALEVVNAARWKRALSALGSALKHRRKVAVDAVSATFGAHALTIRPRGGYHLWVSLPAHIDDGQLVSAALARGVALTPGANYYPTDSSTPHVRLSYVAAASTADVDDAVRRLAPLLIEPGS